MSTHRLIRFKLNGVSSKAMVSSQDTLIDLLQNQFDLKGARESCSQGLCGCCTVYLNGKAISACLSLAWFADGAEIRTIEDLAQGETLDPVQQAFIDTGSFPCGFCTPGIIMMTKTLIAENPDPTDDEIRHYLAGNLCRCSANPEIVDAVKLAAARNGATGLPVRAAG